MQDQKVKQRIELLRKQKDDLEKNFEEQSTLIDDIENEIRKLSMFKKEYLKGTSPLAKKLSKSTTAQLKELKSKKKETLKKIEQISTEILKVDDMLKEKSFDYYDYIVNQVEFITNQFIKYVAEHEEEIGRQIYKTYFVNNVKNFSEVWNAYEPTIYFGICDASNNYIALSRDFIMTQVLCTFKKTGEGTICNEEEWFTNYKDLFISLLLESLEKNFKSENFELSIDSPSITLKLV